MFFTGVSFFRGGGDGGGKRWENVKLTSGNGKLKNIIIGQ